MSKRIGLILGVAVQLAVLIGMIALKAGPLLTGETVLLRVLPIDPRDLFRGDYVTLSYEFSQMKPGELPELGTLSYNNRAEWQGTTVYVSLVPEEDGKHWRKDKISTKPPASGKYLRGTLTSGNRIAFGIESYYVQEGGGREFEDAARGHRLSAEAALAADGQAVLPQTPYRTTIGEGRSCVRSQGKIPLAKRNHVSRTTFASCKSPTQRTA